MKTKKLMTILVLILIISMAYGTYNISLSNFKLSDANNSYLGGLTWYRSAPGLEKGFQIAQQENKPIAVYFWAIWCQYCAKFQSDTLGNPQVKEILEKDYVLVAMDLDVDRDISGRYGVSYPPYVIFLDLNGTVLERVPGAVDANYFLPVVTRVRDQVRGK
ncbi:MAG: thioredoxin family protein [Candidatus Methanoperedens sp.]|nr:thioredoxin family protein [Candidatus Methanoperedens sp.]MCZ7403567.1 thioredoxin family protein [Candidatus Methanoperedens sp.]